MIEAPFKHYLRTMTPEKGYKEGYASGLNWRWPDRPEPGGPWVCRNDGAYRGDTDWDAYCDLTAEVNLQWRLGWQAGRAASSEVVAE